MMPSRNKKRKLTAQANCSSKQQTVPLLFVLSVRLAFISSHLMPSGKSLRYSTGRDARSIQARHFISVILRLNMKSLP
jgi:hypothetical protein